MKHSEIIMQKLDVKDFYEKHLLRFRVGSNETQASALCPFHDDRNPSLSVNVRSGLFYCFSCGAKGNVLQFYMRLKDVDFRTALHEMGMLAGVSGVEQQVTAIYPYHDHTGKTIYLKQRLEPGYDGRSKAFVFKYLENGIWVKGRGCDPVLYNLPEVAQSKQIFIVEGEGKVEHIRSWGLVGTCLDSGARSPWRAEYMQFFENKEVIVVPDNDEPGRQYAEKISSALFRVAGEIKIIDLPGLQEGEDIINWKGEENGE